MNYESTYSILQKDMNNRFFLQFLGYYLLHIVSFAYTGIWLKYVKTIVKTDNQRIFTNVFFRVIYSYIIFYII